MSFDDQELPKLPTLEPKDMTDKPDSTTSAKYSASQSLRPMTYGASIPSPIIESPVRITRDQSITQTTRNMSITSGNHLTTPQRKSRR